MKKKHCVFKETLYFCTLKLNREKRRCLKTYQRNLTEPLR